MKLHPFALLPFLFLPPSLAAPALTLPAEAMTAEGAAHALNRLGFGPRPGDIEAVQAMGVDRWVAAQLDPARVAESPALESVLAGLPTLHESNAELFRRDAQLRRDKSDEGNQARRDFVRTVLGEAATAHLDRALLSNRQLQEVLAGFWFNHFNVFAGKGFDHVWVGDFENAAIRPHVFGNFRTLLEATARHPAMLFYLDNWQNGAPGSRGRHGEEIGLNENYARELMELHTLGVDGGYTQQDVTELARILTGWGLRTRGEGGRFFGGKRPADFSFAFDPERHDYGDRVLLGVKIGGQGWQEIDRALDILAANPATARHLSFQLAQFFVADQPDKALVERMTQTWMATRGDLTAVMVTLLQSKEFWAPRTKFKTPFEFVVSALRASAIVLQEPRPVFDLLRQLGQPIYGIETPDGYKQVEAAWLNPDAMTRRLSFAAALGTGHFGAQPAEVSAQTVRNAMSPSLSPQTEKALAEADPRMRTALLLGSPDFMKR